MAWLHTGGSGVDCGKIGDSGGIVVELGTLVGCHSRNLFGNGRKVVMSWVAV